MLIVVGARTSSKSVWAYSDSGALMWDYDTGGNTNTVHAETNGTVYIGGTAADNSDGNGTRNCWKLTSNGKYVTGAYINSKANIWDIDGDSNYLYIALADSAIRTSKNFTSIENIVTTSGAYQAIRVDSSGNIYIGSGGTPLNVYKYNSSLVQQWTKDPQTSTSCSSIRILSGGDIIASIDNDIYRYKADGTGGDSGEWSYVFGGAGLKSRLDIDSNDKIFAVRYNGSGSSAERFVELNDSGTRQGGVTTASGDIEDIVITNSDAVYICGDVVSSYNVRSVDTTAYTLTNLFNSGGALIQIAWSSVTLSEKTFSKELISISNNEVWRESSSGTLAELTAANGDVNTAAPLTIVEAFEKVFIANETNLKVADFGNTKIATANLGANPPDNANVLTGGTSGAEMVVDYITALSSACTIYGKRITDATFEASETVTGTDDDGNAISFTMTAVVGVEPPHWYDWTVYGNSSTYGVMPAQANKVFRYQGRVGLTVDPDYPHQWYLPRVNNPWDWNYVTTADDTQSPVAGEDAEAGQAGDIVVTAIPYSNDYLILACANSLQYIVGNPAEGGSMLDLDNNAGILGVRAFCWDNKGNLYILATTGLLRIPNGFGIPENLTEISYPNFIKDLAYNASTHRIVMGYDRTGHGIKIAKTTISSGANSGWWYDLKTEGLSPESYADTGCGIFSMFHYEAVDPTYNKLLFGCNDGYIRFSDPSSKSDIKADDTNQAIDSYVTFGPLKLGGENREGKIDSIIGITTGGEASGTVTDSNDLYYRLWTGLSADEIVEKLAANASPQIAGTITAPGRRRGSQKRQSVRGAFAGIRIGNSTVEETWGLERLILGASQKGRVK
jgi:hypothetical protein